MRSRRATIGMVIVGLALLLLVGCTGGGGTSKYAVSGTVTGVDGNGIKGVALSFEGFGTADTDEDGQWRKDGLSGTVKVVPTKDGWAFKPTSRTVSKADSSVNFVATILEYPLTIQVQGEGTVNQEIVVTAQGTEYEHGTQVELTAVPHTGWSFSHWEGDLQGNTNPETITVDKGKSITAVFAKIEYTLNITVQGEGTVNQEVVVAAQGTEYEHGTQVQLTAVPATGWRFSHWEGDLEGNENLATIVVDGEKAVIAVFIRLVEAPSNLRGIIRGEAPRGAYRELQWDPVDHPHLTHYRVWIFDAKYDKFVYLGKTLNDETIYNDLENITVGNPRRYKVSAVASYMGITLESELSEEITLTIGTMVPPLPPEWDPVDPIGTSGTEESISLFLNWEPVIQREDGTSVDSLFQYEVWSLIGEEFRRISAVSPEETETTIIYNKYARGSNVSIALKAVDLWGNSSELSEVRSIILGGAPPMPPEFTLENINTDGTDKVRVSINKVNKDVNGEDTSVVKYKIYRSQFHIPTTVVHTITDEDPLDSSNESFEWIDSGVIRYREYYYTVVAVDDNGNESEMPDVKSIEIGDDVPPQPPEVIDYGSRVEGKTIINWIKFKMPTDEDLKSVLVFMGLSPDHLSDISNIPKNFADEDGIYTFEHSYGLENGVEYFYRLIGVDHSDNWTPKMMDEMFSIIAGDVTKPEAPVLLAEGEIKEIDGELIPLISLTWNKVEEVTGYRIYKTQTNVSNSFVMIAEIDNPDIVSYEDSHLPNGLKCWYYIVAYNKLGVLSERSEVVTAIAGDTVGPAAPNLSVESLTYNTNLVVDVRLVWDKDSDAVLYEVFRSDNNGITYRQIGSVSEGLFVDKVDYPRSAKYYVVGYDALGNRGDRSVETLVQTERMTTPSSVFIDSIESAELPGGLYSAKIDWSSYELDEPEFFRSYRVYIGTTNNPSSASIIHQILDPEIKNYTVEDLVFLEEYYFGISVLDIFGKESDLTMFQFVPEDTTTPSVVRNLRGNEVELGVRIQWDPPKTNEDGTVIYDLAGYLIETSVDGEAFIELDRISSTTFLHHVSDDLSRYYRVSAYDNKPTPNFGEATVIGPFKAITLTRGLFDQTPPNHVSNITFPSYGIDTSSDFPHP